MKKEILINGKILLALLCIIFLPVFIAFCVYKYKKTHEQKSVETEQPQQMSVERIKALIELSSTIEQVDDILENYAGYKTYEEKIEFLKKYFDCEILDKNKVDSIELEYILLVDSIIHSLSTI